MTAEIVRVWPRTGSLIYFWREPSGRFRGRVSNKQNRRNTSGRLRCRWLRI